MRLYAAADCPVFVLIDNNSVRIITVFVGDNIQDEYIVRIEYPANSAGLEPTGNLWDFLSLVVRKRFLGPACN